MARPESERRFLRLAVQEGYLTVEQAATIVGERDRRGDRGLHAIRDLAIRTGLLAEGVAYKLFQAVSREMREVPDDLDRVGGYEILEPLAKGSMAVVFKARQVSLDKVVALKILPAGLSEDPVFHERFLREARAVARLNHPNIVAALDAGVADGYHFFAMEYVDGSTIRDIVQERGPIDEREALKVAYFVARALKHAHQAGIVHRDVKPANIMLARDGRVKLTDLGLARLDEESGGDPSLTQEGKSVGTPYYMSPEQARTGQVADTRSDIYAVGATLFYMLTGRPPYEGETPSAILEKHVRAPIPDPRVHAPSVSERTVVLLRRILAKRPEDRPQNPGELASAIKAILQGRSPHSPDPEAAPRAPHAAPGALAATTPAAIPAVAAPVQAMPQLPHVPPVPWAPGAQPIYVAHQVAGGAGHPSPPGVSSMQLTPVWLEPVTQKPLAQRFPGHRGRRAAARRRPAAGVPAAVPLIAAFIIAAIGVFVALGRSEVRPSTPGALASARAPSAQDDRSRTESAHPERGARERDGPVEFGEAERLRGHGRASAESKGQAGPRRFNADEEQRRRAEALDRAEAERRARDPEAARLAREAKEIAAIAETAAARAREAEEARERAAAEAAAREADVERVGHAEALADIAARLRAEDVRGAVPVAERAAARFSTPAVRTRAERDLAAVRRIDGLVELAARGLEKRKGERERLALRSLPAIEGEVAAVSAADVTIAPALGGRVVVPLRDLTLFEQRRLARVALGQKSPDVYAAEGCFYLYTGEPAKGRRHLELAAREGLELGELLARAAEIEAAQPPPAGEEAAATPSPAPEAGPDGGAPARPERGGPEGEPEPETGKDAPAVASLSEAMLLRLFEFMPAAFAPDGSVRFRYGLMEQKRLPLDFAVDGGDLRYDQETKTLRLEGNQPRRLTHRALFVGPVRLDVEIAFQGALGRQSALVLFAEETGSRATAIESIFGIDLTDRRRGKPFARAGPLDPIGVAAGEIRPDASYRFRIDLGSPSVAGIDGGNRAVLDAVELGPSSARRVGIAAAGLSAQLRAVEIEGRLDLRWVAREIQRRPVLPPR